MNLYDIVIIGAGPAGCSAGIYAKRAGVKTLLIDGGDSVLFQAKKIQNYYGFDNISGKDLFEKGIKQYKNLGGDFEIGQVVSITQNFENNFYNIKLKDKSFIAKVLILCMGGQKPKKIEGLEGFQNVSYCAVCDGFFYKNKTIAVIGDGDYAVSECKELENIVDKIYLLTNGKELEYKSKNVEVINQKITNFKGTDFVNQIVMENGWTLNVDGVFVALGKMGSLDISLKLGILTNNNSILVDKNMMTNIPGIFAGGDAVGGLLQISKSVSDGAKAGLEAVRYLKFMELNSENK